MKQATHLQFGATPYLAILTDSTGTPMRERFVYFTFSGTSAGGAQVNATRSAETNVNGLAELRGMSVPAGNYTVKATFPGSIPKAGGGTIDLNDPFYLPSSATTQVTADRTAPTCVLMGINYNSSGVAASGAITVQDTGSGIASVNPAELTNAVFSVPGYSAGVTTPLQVTIARTNLTQSWHVALDVVDGAGNVNHCAFDFVQVGINSPEPTEAVVTFPAWERSGTVFNGKPGVEALKLTVDEEHSLDISDLKPGEVRSFELQHGDNDGNDNGGQGNDGQGNGGQGNGGQGNHGHDHDQNDQNRTVKVSARGDRSGMAVVLFSGQQLTQP
jgi:hypothetical protein